jgi:hypothetical protein
MEMRVYGFSEEELMISNKKVSLEQLKEDRKGWKRQKEALLKIQNKIDNKEY